MKIAVYAICKNEEKHIVRFLASCEDADYVVIADTGSTDDSWFRLCDEKSRARVDLKLLKINVVPFRFDDARNAALAAVPADTDMCIAMDMDEVLEPGWRQHVEAGFAKGANSIVFTFDPVNANAKPFEQNNRIHARKGFRWGFPAHEALICSLHNEIVQYKAPGLVMKHYSDNDKPRCYLELLAWGEWENPADPRMKFYYARELFFFKYYKEAIEKFDQYRELTIALNYAHLSEIDDAKRWRQMAAVELARGADASDKVGPGEVPSAGLMDAEGLHKGGLGGDGAGEGERVVGPEAGIVHD